MTPQTLRRVRTMRTGTLSWQLNARYVRYCLVALAISMIGHLAYLLLGPAPEASPYRLETKPMMRVVPIPPDYRTPPPPPDVPRPPPPQAIDPSDDPDLDPDERLPETVLDPLTWQRPQAPARPSSGFVPYDTEPAAIRIVRPVYPALAREAYAQGFVKVLVTIDERGRVIEAVVHETNAIQSLQDAALEAARQCLFRPARQRDLPVKARFILPYSFTIH